MTKSTGKRERQRKRRELFSAEMKLRRVHRYLLCAVSLAHAWGAREALRDYLAAFGIVTKLIGETLAEERACS
jgi:hypothetical protein